MTTTLRPRKLVVLSAAFCTLVAAAAVDAQDTLVPLGSSWRYLDNGTFPGSTWITNGFADGAWQQGPAQLGYGDGDESTVVSFGPNPNNKYITTYFRRRLNVSSPAAVTGLLLKVVRDDGIVVYLNGREVLRDNLPEGAISFTSRANSAVGGADETTFVERVVDPTLLRAGENVLAAEVHQANPTSSDLGFDLQLEATVFPSNQPPLVDAGADLAGTVGEPVALAAVFQDDGLPTPPGVPAFLWTKESGPGAVIIADPETWVTSATFEAPGTYVLRLTATDSVTSVFDEVTVTIVSALEPPQVQSLRLLAEPLPAIELTFTGTPGRYRILQSASLEAADWKAAATVVIPSPESAATVALPYDDGAVVRFYRVARDP